MVPGSVCLVSSPPASIEFITVLRKSYRTQVPAVDHDSGKTNDFSEEMAGGCDLNSRPADHQKSVSPISGPYSVSLTWRFGPLCTFM